MVEAQFNSPRGHHFFSKTPYITYFDKIYFERTPFLYTNVSTQDTQLWATTYSIVITLTTTEDEYLLNSFTISQQQNFE